jgi:hypothetical protein
MWMEQWVFVHSMTIQSAWRAKSTEIELSLMSRDEIVSMPVHCDCKLANKETLRGL